MSGTTEDKTEVCSRLDGDLPPNSEVPRVTPRVIVERRSSTTKGVTMLQAFRGRKKHKGKRY